MSLKSILIAGSALASSFAFAGSASAHPYYACNGSWCYDDQAEETRELNLLQLEHPGAGVYAVPGYRGRPGLRHRGDNDDRYADDDDGDDGDDNDGDRYGGGSDGGGYRMRGDDDRGGYGMGDDDGDDADGDDED